MKLQRVKSDMSHMTRVAVIDPLARHSVVCCDTLQTRHRQTCWNRTNTKLTKTIYLSTDTLCMCDFLTRDIILLMLSVLYMLSPVSVTRVDQSKTVHVRIVMYRLGLRW